MAKVLKAEVFRPVSLLTLPLGDWPGDWGGYEVTVTIGQNQYRLATDDGIRTPRAECIVHVEPDGEITVEVLD